MPESLESLVQSIDLATLLDIGITALLIYWLFSLIRGTRAVTLIIGVSVLLLVYAAAQLLQLRLLSQILQTGAVIGIFALVVVFQPELRRALERIGRVGSLRWLVNPNSQRTVEHVSREVARATSRLAAEGAGALIVIERETGVGEIAETGVRIDGDLSADLLRTLFSPRSPLHDGAVVIREDRIIAAGAVLPLAETTIQSERLGTRHRAALGLTEQTDAVVVVVSEERHQVSIVERARIVRNLTEAQIERALVALLEAPTRPPTAIGRPSPGRRATVRSPGVKGAPAGGQPPTAETGPADGQPPTAETAPADGQPPTGGPTAEAQRAADRGAASGDTPAAAMSSSAPDASRGGDPASDEVSEPGARGAGRPERAAAASQVGDAGDGDVPKGAAEAST